VTVPVTQYQAIDVERLSLGERVRFRAAERFAGMECLEATFTRHEYPPHTHETYVVGTIEAGCEMWHARGAKHYAGPGDFAFNNPLDVHDGIPFAGGYTYRMTYPSVELMSEIARAITGEGAKGTPFFRTPVAHDPEGARLFGVAHAAMMDGSDRLRAEELLLRAYARLLVAHAEVAPVAIGSETGPVRRVRDAIEARYAEDLSLDELAGLARLSRNHLIRAFRREVGLTPHAYVVDTRIRRAKSRLARGEAPADVAVSVGFSDQAHLTRAFKARMGVGPAAFRRGYRA